MDKGSKTILFCAITAIVILVSLFGCGKRVISTTQAIIKSDSLRISNILELKQNATFSDIGTVRPFDASKPMFWAGSWHYNVVLEFDKSIKKGIELKSNESLSYKASESKRRDKKSEKTDHANIWIGLSLVIGTLFVLYLTLKKYKIL